MKDRKKAVLSLTIDKDLYAKLAEYAKQDERSLSFVAKKAIEMFLKEKTGK